MIFKRRLLFGALATFTTPWAAGARSLPASITVLAQPYSERAASKAAMGCKYLIASLLLQPYYPVLGPSVSVGRVPQTGERGPKDSADSNGKNRTPDRGRQCARI